MKLEVGKFYDCNGIKVKCIAALDADCFFGTNLGGTDRLYLACIVNFENQSTPLGRFSEDGRASGFNPPELAFNLEEIKS